MKKENGLRKMRNWVNILVHREDGSIEEDNVNNITAREEHRFEGWECWAGLQQITINNDGDVFRAICKQGGKLGNIYDGFDMPTETVICAKKECHCAADIQLSKASPGHVNKLRVGKDD